MPKEIIMYENRQYMILNVSELESIDFATVLESSSETVRKSIDRSKTFVKWNGDMPTCVSNLITKTGPYSHSEMINILNTPEWTEADMAD